MPASRPGGAERAAGRAGAQKRDLVGPGAPTSSEGDQVSSCSVDTQIEGELRNLDRRRTCTSKNRQPISLQGHPHLTPLERGWPHHVFVIRQPSHSWYRYPPRSIGRSVQPGQRSSSWRGLSHNQIPTSGLTASWSPAGAASRPLASRGFPVSPGTSDWYMPSSRLVHGCQI